MIPGIYIGDVIDVSDGPWAIGFTRYEVAEIHGPFTKETSGLFQFWSHIKSIPIEEMPDVPDHYSLTLIHRGYGEDRDSIHEHGEERSADSYINGVFRDRDRIVSLSGYEITIARTGVRQQELFV